jgi:uncharacterized protein YndB with AHSA1/START domain
MDTVGETSFATPGDRELEITRTFDAPRQAVFDAFTVCEAAQRWMGPPGWEFASCEIDLRPGGAYRIVSRTPQGYEIDNGGTVDEISSPERLVTTQDAGAGRTRHTLVLTEDGGGTTMTYAVEYPTTEMRDAAAAMTEAMDAGYDKLAEYLRTTA